jgi:hypothetical protein
VYGTGSFPFYVTATDDSGFCVSKNFSMTVKAPTITLTAKLLAGAVGIKYNGSPITASEKVTGTATAPSVTCAVYGLPAGLSFSAGSITGTPTVGGTYSVLVTVTDANGFSYSKTFSLVIKGPAIVITATLPAATAGVTYASASSSKTYGFAAKDTATKSTAFSYKITGLPDGLTQSGTSGAVYGIPTVQGSFPIQVVASEVYDSNTVASTYGIFILTVKAPTITLSSGSLTLSTGTQSVLFTAAEKTARGATFTYSVSGQLPPDLNKVDSYWAGAYTSSGASLGGLLTASDVGTYPIVVSATDVNGFSIVKTFTLKVKTS